MLQCCAMMCGGICSASVLLQDDHCLLPFFNQIKPPTNHFCWKWKPICMQVSRHAFVLSTCSLKLKHQNSGIKTRGLECVLLTLLVEIWSSVVMAPLKLQRPKAQGITGYPPWRSSVANNCREQHFVTGAVAPFILFCPDRFYNRWFWCISAV